MRVILGLLALVCFLLLAVKYPLRKLGLHNVREVTMFAISHGLMQVNGQ